MTKNVAVFESAGLRAVLTMLHEVGFELRNPHLGHISGWNSDGEEVKLDSYEAAYEFIGPGTGIVMWRGTGDSLFLGFLKRAPYISFDGFTASEERDLVEQLSQHGMQFSILHEDAAYG
jgi:hypothetical protein